MCSPSYDELLQHVASGFSSSVFCEKEEDVVIRNGWAQDERRAVHRNTRVFECNVVSLLQSNW